MRNIQNLTTRYNEKCKYESLELIEEFDNVEK